VIVIDTRVLGRSLQKDSATGRGGMLTKIEAGQIAMNCGRIAVIANGQENRILDRILPENELALRFCKRNGFAGNG
jgi:glutamate 5-kinase